ncbi:MAG TPA: hydroxymethylglutaryl-CoA lyase [Acidimicrobiia bacterium]|nr:hydroxymethylglutaryl-CoA lyase [Acidimicrobiia bacterium]
MIEIVEVGPRDGLQSEDRVLPVATRVELIRRLEAAGAGRIETVSFADPRLVPQIEGAEEICDALRERTFRAIGLVLNGKGLDRALESDLDEVNLVAYASDGYAEKNSAATAAHRNAEAAGLVSRAKQSGLGVSVTISVAFGDPIDGSVAPERTASIAGDMAAAGADEIALGDTIGVAVPRDVGLLLDLVRAAAPGVRTRCHFHNTRNTGYANALAALAARVDALDASVGGFGGSPFSPQAGGNVATEDLAWMLERSGLETGLDIPSLTDTGSWLARELGYDRPPAMAARAGDWPA